MREAPRKHHRLRGRELEYAVMGNLLVLGLIGFKAWSKVSLGPGLTQSSELKWYLQRFGDRMWCKISHPPYDCHVDQPMTLMAVYPFKPLLDAITLGTN